jgi:integrase
MEMELREGIAKLITVPKGRRDVLVWDTKTPGFFLRKFASGRAMWGVRYHVGKKQRRVHLYDAAVRGTLSKAKSEAADVRARARLGTDVVAQRAAAAEASAKTITLGKLAELYLADRRIAKRNGSGEPAWRPRYVAEVERQLTRDWKPLAGTAIQAITRQDIVKVIDELALSNGAVSADRARAALSGLYAWAIDRGYCDVTPVLHIKPRAENGARDRTLTEVELREVWLAADRLGGDYGRIVKLLILTGQRRDEIGSLFWAEIQAHGDDTRIELPGERTKNHCPHIVPLSAEAAAVLPSQPNGRLMVFGRIGTGFSGWSKAKLELDEAIAAARRARRVRTAMPPWRLHDIRRTVVTQLVESRTRTVETPNGPREETWRFAEPHVVEAIVNHNSGHKAGVAGMYNKALYLSERRQALELWGAHIAALVDGRHSKVVPFKRAR